MKATDVLGRWDDQQAAYISRREERFEVMLDVLDAAVRPDCLVLDLACGPGSITARVLRRFPQMQCLGVDFDPSLLQLATAAAKERGDDKRARFVDADLASANWLDTLDGERPDAVLSSTALHWLTAPDLVRLYSDLGQVLAPGAVFLNADHLRASTGRTLFHQCAEVDDQRTQAMARASGVDSWDEWFALLSTDAAYDGARHVRTQRFADRPPNPPLSLEFHVSALEAAGFVEAGPVWQHFDDYIVLARR